MKVRWHADWMGLRPSTTRIPFRYGKACLVHCPQLLVQVSVEIDGRSAEGFAGDCLPPGWFDKTPGKSYLQQLEEMLATIKAARDRYVEAFAAGEDFFPGWLRLQQEIDAWCGELEIVPLLASFGLSLWERAVLDAACRAHDMCFADAVRGNLFAIDPGAAHPQLAGTTPADWLPPEPLQRIAVRHTVGMGDPLEWEDVTPSERLDDGRPQTLRQYIRQSGIRYFKLKLGGQLDADLARLGRIVAVIEAELSGEYGVTLDGNEQFDDWEQLTALLEAMEADRRFSTLWNNTIAIEQPLPRSIALERPLDSIAARLAEKPVIIDESDGTLDAYPRAIALGYGGVSSKNCKGALRSLLNAGLVQWAASEYPHRKQLMTGEDLCSVGVVPVQADLCLAATLGLSHVERNGHHFHPGLSYLPPASQQEALQAHPDFYIRIGDIVSPRLHDGEFSIASLHCHGFGFDWRPRRDDWQAPQDFDWSVYRQ